MQQMVLVDSEEVALGLVSVFFMMLTEVCVIGAYCIAYLFVCRELGHNFLVLLMLGCLCVLENLVVVLVCY